MDAPTPFLSAWGLPMGQPPVEFGARCVTRYVCVPPIFAADRLLCTNCHGLQSRITTSLFFSQKYLKEYLL